MGRLVVGPFNRVEGDLEVRLDTEGGSVRSAQVVSPLYRGFEQILVGKHPLDALVYTPRICGICSVAQSVAAARALTDLQQLEVPPNGRLVCDLMLGVENLADHLSHFYLFFMPDFARQAYAGRDWYQPTGARFAATQGSACAQALRARGELLRCMGLLAGKWPHSLALQPGGSTRAITASEKLRLQGLVRGLRRFLETQTFGCELEVVAAIQRREDLDAWRLSEDWRRGDLRWFLHLGADLSLDALGRAYDRFLSYGAYPGEGDCLFRGGYWEAEYRPLEVARISEDVSHAWLGGSEEPLHPSRGVTLPQPDRAQAYTWCKAPRLAGRALETGALARQVVAGNPLFESWVRDRGASVAARVCARLIECALVVPAIERWIGALRPGEPFCTSRELPEQGRGVGLTEAARGSLGHWLEVRNGYVLNYQIVAPTTWNFSPRDRDGQPGALETALIGTPVQAGETTPVAVQHVVRSFDPCMVCTVH